MDPLWVRVIFLVFNLSIIFAMNALFFTDSLIDSRANTSNEDAVNIIIIIYILGWDNVLDQFRNAKDC